jgi:uncharacterized protein
MTFVDSSAWFTLIVPGTPEHERAKSWLAEKRRPLITTDYVVDEVLTLLRSRREGQAAIALGNEFFDGQLAAVHILTRLQVLRAWNMFRTYRDKDWSFTDCTSFVLIEELGIPEAFAFDQHFRQFGKVTVVP